MSTPVFASDLADSLKLTLDEVVTDDSDGLEAGLLMSKMFDEGGMKDHYEDDLEVGGMGLASEKPEGQEMATGTIKEGSLTRYIARMFALRMIVTEEAMDDCRYDQVIMAKTRLKRSMYKTVDVDAALMLARGFNTSYTFGDGVCLWSASHTLPQGGTFSNLMATAMSPSRTAMTVLRAQARKLPGHDGIVRSGGYKIEKIICPVEQESTWEGIVMSTHAPEAGQFNEINVVNQTMGLGKGDIIANPFWDVTTTAYAVKTNCDIGWRWKWRKKMQTRSWVENSMLLMHSAIYARWARGCSDARSSIGVNA